MTTGHGWFGNHRSLKEQMMGLGPALEESNGKAVLDAGCAEGHIAVEFAKAGARVDAFDNNPGFVVDAESAARKHAKGAVRVKAGDINVGLPDPFGPAYDVVLALAILHKAESVYRSTKMLADACSGLMVVRLPKGSTGMLRAKFGPSWCDLNIEMPNLGFHLERTESGPRGELVQYWRRRA